MDIKAGLSLLPLDFLEAYPFPAFALHVPIPLEPKSEDLFAAISLGSPTPGEERLNPIEGDRRFGPGLGLSNVSSGGSQEDGRRQENLMASDDAFGSITAPSKGPTIVEASDGKSDPVSTAERQMGKIDDHGAPVPPTSTFVYNPFLRAGHDHNATEPMSNQTQRVQLSDIPFTRHRTMAGTLSGLIPVWGNGKWRAIVKDRRLLDCISVTEARQFGNWVSGLTEWEIRRLATAERQKKRREDRRREAAAAEAEASVTKAPKISRGNSGGSARSYASESSGSSGLDMSQSRTWQKRKSRRPSQDSLDPELTTTELRKPASVTSLVQPPSLSEELEDEQEAESGRPPEVSYKLNAAVLTALTHAIHIEDEESQFLDELLDQPTLTLHFQDPGISLELVKTSYPTDPPDRSLSYLVIQAIPRRLVAKGPQAAEEFRGGVKATEHARAQRMEKHVATDLRSLGAWPFDRSGTSMPGRNADPARDAVLSPSSSSNQETPVLERPGLNFAPSTTTDKDRSDRQTWSREKQAAVTNLLPAGDAMLVGAGDTDQFAELRNSANSTISIEDLLRNIDWDRHSLGPIERWPQSLKTAFSLVMSIPGQAMLWWGKDLCLLYNDHYARMVRGKHPGLFASEGSMGYAEAWAALGPLAEQVLAGTALAKDDDPFLFVTLEKKTPLIEMFHSWLWSPIRDETGSIGGLFNFTRETTKKVLAERRLRCIRDTNDLLAASRNLNEFDQAVTESFSDEAIAKDLPFSIFYHVTEEDNTNTEQAHNFMDGKSVSSGRYTNVKLKLTRGGLVGVPDDHPSAPKHISLAIQKLAKDWGALDPHRTSSPTMSMISALSGPLEQDEVRKSETQYWPFKDALNDRKAIVMEDISDLINGFSIRSWDMLPHSAIVLPVYNESSADIPALVMVLGLNPRRPFDSSYRDWMHQLRVQLFNGLLQVRSVEAETRRTRELREMDAMKTNWIASVSHELRLPLTLIGGPLDDLIGQTPENGRQHGPLVMAKRNVNRLARLIDQLMDYSRVEAGKMTGRFRPTPLGSYTNDLAVLFRSAIEKARLEYIVDCEADEGRVCYVDPDLFEKVALNLLGNAFKYTHKGFIKVTLRYTASSAKLVVSDSGVGIPAGSLNRVTERFFRASNSARSHEGSGIGLSLTEELIRLHGGTLEVTSVAEAESTDGSHGSTFTVTLPLGLDHLPAVEEAGDGPGRKGNYARGVIEEAMQWNRDDATSTSGSDSGSAPSSNLLPSSSDKSAGSLDPNTLFFTKDDCILIVDDSRDLRTYLASIFAPYVGRVLQAGDGAQGLQVARSDRPELIISDVMMPVMDGLQMLQAIKSSEDGLQFTPVILLSAKSGEGERVEGLLAGVEDYMTKPFNSKELLARASMQVQLGRRRRVLEESFRTRLDEVEKRREEAESERRRQELLIDVTSHELRNPTSAIIQASSMVLQDLTTLRSAMRQAREAGTPFEVTEELLSELSTDEELLQNIFTCANTQNTISSDILTLATISLDKLTFSEAVTDVRKRMQEVSSMFALEAKSKGITLNIEASDSMLGSPLVVTDPARLGQILVNLTANAIKWTADREIRKITFHLALAASPPFDASCAVPGNAPLPPTLRDGDPVYLYIGVTDTGPGLPQVELEKLFQRFSQAKQTGPNKVFGGAGLGLYVSRKISEQMGGRIEVVSVLGEGATFRFFIKVKAAGVKHKEGTIGTGGAAPPVARRRSSIEREIKPHVLVVEDNMINQRLILRQLRKAGFTCEAASNGLEAVQRIRQVCSTTKPIDKPFDTVLLDLEMPVMGGLEAIRIIRGEEAQSQLTRSTVFALTGNARQGQIDDARANGMDAVIIKPYRLDQVLDMITEATQQQHKSALSTTQKAQSLPLTSIRSHQE